LYFGVTVADCVAEKAEVSVIRYGLWRQSSVDLPLVRTINMSKVWVLAYGLGEIVHVFSVLKQV